MAFVHLHTHGEYSQLDGIGNADKYAEVAASKGFKSLALTDHGNIDGVIKHQKACVKHGINPIIGCELYIVEDLTFRPPPKHKERRSHMTCLVKNKTGYENLMKMITVSNIEGFHRSPRVDPQLVLENYEGLVFMSACASTFLKHKWGSDMFLELNDVTNCFLEIMPHDMKLQRDTNELKMKFHKQYNIPLVATQDSHYPCPEDAKTQEVLLALQRKASMLEKTEKEGGKRWAFDINNLYLTTESEIRNEFKKQGGIPPRKVGKAISNTQIVADLCKDFRIEELPVKLPMIPQAKGKNEIKMMEDIIWKGFDERLGDKLDGCSDELMKQYEDRIEEEFSLIAKQGFERYFLIVWELLNWSRSKGFLCGPGRGSVGGSLVAYCMYLTDVDPIEHKLLFSRFISPARIDYPDIDMDFEDIRRQEIKAHFEELYGKHNVCGVSTFLRMKGRGALRDVARAYNVPYSDTDAAAKQIVVRSGGDFRANFSITDAFEEFEDCKKFKKKYPEVTDLAISLEGQVKGSGQHAAAMCISIDDLREGKRTALALRKGVLVCNWDKYDCEGQGLMKLDVLGLSTLTVLNYCKKLIKENHGEDVIYHELDLNDKDIYEMIAAGRTVGLFQLGSVGLQQYCKDLKPECFDDIVDATSLWRPGTLRTGMAYEYIDRKNGKEYETLHPYVDELTKDTQGIILYQEQIMLFCYELAGMGWKTCDTIRKVISKSQGDELFQKFKKTFVDGCVNKGTLDAKTADSVWDTLSSFGSYGFNRSHAVEYSMITYWTAWCKIHYPAEFMASSLTYGAKDDGKREMYVEECRKMDLTLEMPKVGISDAVKWTTKDGKLYIPFMEIKGIGENAAKSVANAENLHVKKGFFDAEYYYAGEHKPSKTVLANLNRIHSFDKRVLSERESEDVNDMFGFDVSKDKMRAVRGIYEFIEKRVKLTKLDSQSWTVKDSKKKWMFGQMIEMRYTMKKDDGGGSGAYGFFKDDAGTLMLQFHPSLYADRKNDIEHCEKDFILVEVSSPNNNAALTAHRVILQKDLISANFYDFIDLELVKDQKVDPEPIEPSCTGCALQCGQAENFQKGETNIMIIFEKPPTPKVYDLVFKYLDTRDDDFHITSMIKCPSKKDITDAQINSCYNTWVKKEIEETKPIAILAFGNLAMRAFKNQERGIVEQSGKTEWHRDHNCWISYCINPGFAMYDKAMMPTFEEGIDNFFRCLENVGF